MKRLFYISLFFILIGCYQDDSQTIQSENASHRLSELSLHIKSMSSHHASFDDIIDNSSCFSIEFPYQIYVNSNLKTISSVEDIYDINADDNIEIVYPVNTNFYNYEEHQANNQTGFNLIKNSCADNFNIESNPCLDFQFPFTIKEFNDLTESFETFQLNTNRQVYLHFENLHDNDIYEIEYPIVLKDLDSNVIRINSNQEFIEAFTSHQNCQ